MYKGNRRLSPDTVERRFGFLRLLVYNVVMKILPLFVPGDVIVSGDTMGTVESAFFQKNEWHYILAGEMPSDVSDTDDNVEYDLGRRYVSQSDVTHVLFNGEYVELEQWKRQLDEKNLVDSSIPSVFKYPVEPSSIPNI